MGWLYDYTRVYVAIDPMTIIDAVSENQRRPFLKKKKKKALPNVRFYELSGLRIDSGDVRDVSSWQRGTDKDERSHARKRIGSLCLIPRSRYFQKLPVQNRIAFWRRQRRFGLRLGRFALLGLGRRIRDIALHHPWLDTGGTGPHRRRVCRYPAGRRFPFRRPAYWSSV